MENCLKNAEIAKYLIPDQLTTDDFSVEGGKYFKRLDCGIYLLSSSGDAPVPYCLKYVPIIYLFVVQFTQKILEEHHCYNDKT